MVRRCVDCGCRHGEDGRRCQSCSRPPLRSDGGEETEGSDLDGTDVEESDAEPFESIVWVCPECGREHQKHSPPCSRCGNVTLEKQRKVHADFETPGGTSYLDVLEFKYVVGYLAVIGFVVLLALSMAGIVSVPWLGGSSPPGAPGDAETYANVSLEGVEEAYVDALNEARAERNTPALSTDSALGRAATEYNQRRVLAARGEGEPPNSEAVIEGYDLDCRVGPAVGFDAAAADDVFGSDTDSDTASGIESIARQLPIYQVAAGSGLVSSEYRSVGVDVHVAPDDTVYATVIVC